MQETIVNNISDLTIIANKILELYKDKKVFAFFGPMGAGKTTLIKELCKQLNVIDNTSSPTFSIINEYKTKKGKSIFHFDFYRLKNETEAFDLGYEDYFYSGNYCFIEWPEKVETLLPEDIVKINITINNENRTISF